VPAGERVPLDACGPGFDPDFRSAERHDLSSDAWLELVPGWADSVGSLFQTVLDAAPWAEREVRRDGRTVTDTRLTTGVWEDPPAPLGPMGLALTQRYGIDLSVVSACLYRDGHDNVAWHGDRIGQLRDETVVATVTMGSTRPFLLRPVAGGPPLQLLPAPGDLVVLGGTAQRVWEHCVPRVPRAEARISVMFRETY
jgi:alkylated DNA repair dioxygenase AlkB